VVKKHKSKTELEAEIKLLKKYNFAEAISGVLQTIARWTGGVLIAYFGYRTVQALAGQVTLADIGLRFLADVKVSEAVAWLFGGSGLVLAARQRKLRRDTVERLEGRIRELEKASDPRRTSSRLTPRGETRPEDSQ